MAQFFPSLEQVEQLKELPTPGERHLLYTLKDILSDEYEVYFQAYFNSLRPDIVVMRKGWGVILIEVKDWRLPAYQVKEDNSWTLSSNGQRLKSPFQQVFGYKKMLFDLHINGLAEAAVMNRNFYNILKPYVYFHGSSKLELDKIFKPAEDQAKEKRNALNQKIQTQAINQYDYDKQTDYWERKSWNVSRDRGMALIESNLSKLPKALSKHVLFTEGVYDEFRRHLHPPFHTANQGKHITYNRKQLQLSASNSGFQKIKGVAGSGKTTILAKRAVNAFKRHQDQVLILTFNLSLKNYIRDRVSEVREDFPWPNFIFTNYHTFISEQRVAAGVPNPTSEKTDKPDYEALFSNEKMFNGFEGELPKFQTILIDEAQDFERPWLKIIRDNFLAERGEMVLFGDESQNIYERKVDRANAELIRGFGRWERLTRSYRSKSESKLTQTLSAFQTQFLISKYDVDTTETSKAGSTQTAFLDLDILQNSTLNENIDIEKLAHFVLGFMKENNIHPNDLCVLGSKISVLRNLDKSYRQLTNEKTNTTFESQELYEELIAQRENSGPNTNTTSQLRQAYDPNEDKALKEGLRKIRRSKKNQFRMNRGTLKISTVHSFKGLEAQNILVLFNEKETAEIVYTAITRSRRNLVTIMPDSGNFAAFFDEHFTPGVDLS